MSELRWHYTKGVHFKSIVDSGVLVPAYAGVPKGETPVVWFSAEPQWEPTAASSETRMVNGQVRLGRRHTMEETYERNGGLCRIGVDPETAPHDWKAFRMLSGVDRKMAESLEAVGRRQGANPANWFVSFRPVTRKLWRAVEVWDGSEWVRVPHE